MPAVDFLTPKGPPKASARGPLMKNLKPSPPTPAVVPASSAKPLGDSPGPRGPPNPNLITDTLTTDTTVTNKLGLLSALLDSLPLPMELVLMDTTGV